LPHICRSVRDGDGLADLLSREPALMIMSPEPDGRLTGADAVNVFAEQMRVVPRWSWTPRDPRAFSCGNVGWITDDPTIEPRNVTLRGLEGAFDIYPVLASNTP